MASLEEEKEIISNVLLFIVGDEYSRWLRLAEGESLNVWYIMENDFCEHLMRLKVIDLCSHCLGLYCGNVSLGLFMQCDCLQH